MKLSTIELNRNADYMTASIMSCRIHDGDAGDDDGTQNRIGTLTQNLAVANWSNAANGDVEYNADVPFGVLDASSQQTPSHYSLWRGNDLVGTGDLSASVVVSAGGTFKINTGTIDLNGSS